MRSTWPGTCLQETCRSILEPSHISEANGSRVSTLPADLHMSSTSGLDGAARQLLTDGVGLASIVEEGQRDRHRWSDVPRVGLRPCV